MHFHECSINERYQTKVAYFSMEFGIHQALKVYAGGLGFLSGSHMRSVYDLKQNTIGIGILWSFGYYDQGRHEDRSLRVEFTRKYYYFLEKLAQKVTVVINAKPVVVKGYLLRPEVFGTAPIILLTTDTDENDFLSRTITHKLYDPNEQTRIAQEIVLGIGGTRMLEALEYEVDIYHMNEGHALPLVFELYGRYRDMEQVRSHVVFTTHTPEKAGNEEHSLHVLHEMGFFNTLSIEEVTQIMGQHHHDTFSLTLGALRSAKIANAVSVLHAQVANEMWKPYEGICPIISITNAQNRRFWTDKTLIRALDEHENYEVIARKKHLKKLLFSEVADQTGKMFDPEIFTIVWARRFTEYKRPGLLKYDMERFLRLITQNDYPVQVIWAGKPYPFDPNAINIFNELVDLSDRYSRIAVLTHYELDLSRMLKQGSDLWLNTPRITREASGTSGMTASMNGSVHFSINDGWHPEFAKDGINSFTIPPLDPSLPIDEQDHIDNRNMMDILEKTILPLYYDRPKEWVKIMNNAMSDVNTAFDTGRMAHEYYTLMYDA
jgi:starch phosphorylase